MPLPILCAIGGSIGTGKTTLAYGLRNKSNRLMNAIVLEGDQVRRELLGYDLAYTMTEKDYSPKVSKQVREIIEKRIKDALLSGFSVIESSGFWSSESQKAIEQIATDSGAKFIGLWLIAPHEVQRGRIVQRLIEREKGENLSVEKGHASDACEGVFVKCDQAIQKPSSERWQTLNSAGKEEAVLKMAVSFID